MAKQSYIPSLNDDYAVYDFFSTIKSYSGHVMLASVNSIVKNLNIAPFHISFPSKEYLAMISKCIVAFQIALDENDALIFCHHHNQIAKVNQNFLFWHERQACIVRINRLTGILP